MKLLANRIYLIPSGIYSNSHYLSRFMGAVHPDGSPMFENITAFPLIKSKHNYEYFDVFKRGTTIAKNLADKAGLLYTKEVYFHSRYEIPDMILIPQELQEQAKAIISSGDLEGLNYFKEILKEESWTK